MSGAPRGARGIALAATVFALVALAALLAGLWFAALQEYRVGANLVADRRAFDAAEAGLDAKLAGWDAALGRLGIGDTAPFAGTLGGGASYTGSVRRLGASLFLVTSTGADARSASRRTLAVVARLAPLRLGLEAALVAAGHVRLGAGALVDAQAPDSGSGCASGRPASGLVLGSAGDLELAGCTAGTCLRGSPLTAVDTTLRGATVPLLGESGWASLVAAAETIGAAGPRSSTSRVWLAPGSFSLPETALPGPAVLLVGGDLVVETGARFSGLVVVRGRLIMRGSAGTIHGSAIAAEADLAALAGASAALVHSKCAAEQALLDAAPARPLRERSWMAVYEDAL